jgi:hypothetical protein
MACSGKMNGNGTWEGPGVALGEDGGSQKPWKQAKLLFVSSDPEEITDTIKYLLRAGVQCAVRRERWNSCYGVWIQKEADFPRALRIYLDCCRPHPLPPWAGVMESLRDLR